MNTVPQAQLLLLFEPLTTELSEVAYPSSRHYCPRPKYSTQQCLGFLDFLSCYEGFMYEIDAALLQPVEVNPSES